MRFLFYSHDGLGLGHTRRHCAVAAALIELAADVPILMASGTDEVHRLGLPACVEVLKMPSLRKSADGGYVSRRLGGLDASEIKAVRSELLLAAVKSFKPDVVLADKHPLGAGGEFKDAMVAAKRAGARTALGLRDILDDPLTVADEWSQHGIRETIDAFYDLVLIYGDRSIFDPVSSYEFSPAMKRRTRMCGYVVSREQMDPLCAPGGSLRFERSKQPLVLAATGGGEDGFSLLDAFLRATRNAPWKGAVVTGPMVPDHELRVLRRVAAESDVDLYPFVPQLPALFGSIDALVCMGGYNTLAEAVSQGVPAVCAPRTTPRKEQLIRAKAFERLGLLKVLSPEELSPERLRQAIEVELTQSREQLLYRAYRALKFDGARQAASHLLALARKTPSRQRRKTSLSTA